MISNTVTGKMELHEGGYKAEIPKNIADLQLARFDKIPEIQRIILKTASVIGIDFAFSLLKEALPQFEDSLIKRHIEASLASGLIIKDNNNQSYSFTHSSMQQVIYKCIPGSQKRELHKQFAQIILNSPNKDDHSKLAYHYYHACIWDKCFKYSIKAAIETLRNNLLNESALLFNQAGEALDNIDIKSIPVDDMITYYQENGNHLVLEGKYLEAYRNFRKWRQYAQQNKMEKSFIDAVIESAHLMWVQSRYNSSRKVLQILLDKSNISNNFQALSRAYSILAEIERRSGNFKQAKEFCYKSIDESEKVDNKNFLSEAYNRLGLALWGEGHLREASNNFNKSLQTADEQRGMYAKGQTRNNLGIISFMMGRFVEADKQLNEALDIFKNIGDRLHTAYSSGNLANICRILGKLDKSELLFKQADLIFQRLNDKHAHYYTIGNLGDLDLIMGKLDIAEEKFRETLGFANEVGDKELTAESKVRFGDLEFFRNNWEKAYEMYKEASEIAEKIGSSEYYLRSCIGMARIDIGEKRNDKARDLIKIIEDKAKTEKIILLENEAAFLKAELARIDNDHDQAIHHYKQILDYSRNDSVFELAIKTTVRLYQIDHEFQGNYRVILQDLFTNFTKNNNQEITDQFIESSYISSFKDSISEILS